MQHFIEMWRAQSGLLLLWSVVCILMGVGVAGTLYWYRVNYVIKRADEELVTLANISTAGDRRTGQDRRQSNRRDVNES